jgi:hypothetical protein
MYQPAERHVKSHVTAVPAVTAVVTAPVGHKVYSAFGVRNIFRGTQGGLTYHPAAQQSNLKLESVFPDATGSHPVILYRTLKYMLEQISSYSESIISD